MYMVSGVFALSFHVSAWAMISCPSFSSSVMCET